MLKHIKRFLEYSKSLICNEIGGTVTKQHTFSAGATIVASEHNDNFDDLFNLVNGNLDNANIDASAAIVATKLNLATIAQNITFSGNNTFAGTTIADLGTVTTADINGGTIDGVTIGGAAAPTVTDLGSVATCDINGGTMDGVQIGGTTATGELIVNNASDDADGLGSQGTSGQFLQSAGAGSNPTWADINQSALSTTTGAVSQATASGAILTNLAGGEYGFYPQFKSSHAEACPHQAYLLYNAGGNITTSYATYIYLNPAGGSRTVYCQQRYVTSSGIDYWIFLRATSNGTIMTAWTAPDHPCYGNGGSVKNLPHPFVKASNGCLNIVVPKTEAKELRTLAFKQNKDLITMLNEEYKVNMKKTFKFEKIHTGQFLGKKPILVDTIPEGLVCRGLKVK